MTGEDMLMKRNNQFSDRSLLASVILIIVMAILLLVAYFRISTTIEERALGRMEEGVNTVIGEVSAKLSRDSARLNAAAQIIADVDSFDLDTLRAAMKPIAPLLETMQMRILLPDNTAIRSDGVVMDANDHLSFAAEAALGEHVSNRMIGILDGNVPILRHFVPVVQNGETVALLYGVTFLEELPDIMNIENLYNARANVFIIDTENGDYIMDTRREQLGNVLLTTAAEVQGATIAETVDKLMSLQTGHFIYQPYDSKDWQYFYYAPAGINQWAIGVAVPKSEAFSSVYEVQSICWELGGVMAVIILIYFLWVRRNARAATAKAVEHAVLEEKLHKAQAAERAKTTFLNNMSHDIRTPMNAIIGFATLAKTNLDNQERLRDYMDKILSSGNYLLSLINDVLDMSRIESGKLNIEEQPCSISEVFSDMRDIVQSQMEAKQLSFTMEAVDVVDEDIYCDKLHLNQVLLNLLSNAMKFTPAGGSVRLTVRQKPGAPEGCGAYQIRVKDTGIGMSSEFLQHIFEPFERERNSTVSGIQGTGLGMPISKSIVDAMDGTITVQSEVGKGTEFTVDLVFRLQSESEKAERGTSTADLPPIEADLKGKRLLVVEDNELNREIATELLTESGFLVETAEDGSVAVEKMKTVEAGYYDLILMDVQMPIMNGYDAARAIRALEGERSSVPIVAMTANAFEEDRQRALDCGMNDHVAKPIDVQVLSDVINRILSQKKLT